MSPPQKVNYDFGAAQDLSRALAQLSDKIQWLIWVRKTNRAKYLDSAPVNWTGRKYRQFTGEFDHQQGAMADLAAAALSLKAQVDQATDQARTAGKALRDRGAE